MLEGHWMFVGYSLDVPRMLDAYSLDVQWMFVGWSLDVGVGVGAGVGCLIRTNITCMHMYN